MYAETCLLPYIRGLRQPEKVLYAWTLPAGEGPDFLSVIDVNLASPTFSTWSTARGGSRQAFLDIRTCSPRRTDTGARPRTQNFGPGGPLP